MAGLIAFAFLILAVGISSVGLIFLLDNQNSKTNLRTLFPSTLTAVDATEATTLLNEGQRKEYEIGSVRFYTKLTSGQREVIRAPRSDDYQHVPCPDCKFLTAHCVESAITVERDYGKAGELRRGYACKHCGHTYYTVHATPPLVRRTLSYKSSRGTQEAVSDENCTNIDDGLMIGVSLGYIASEFLNDD